MYESPADRLREARQRAGYEQAADAMRAFGWKSTYYQHEDGTRGVGRKSAERYARAFRCSPEWLLFGSGERELQIPLIGEVGAGAEVRYHDDHAKGGGVETVDAPPEADPDAVAVRVKGWSMYPAHWPGDVIYYNQQAADPRKLIGLPCVVETQDGRQFVKVLENGSAPGVFNLSSFNEPPLRDVRITWCAPIQWVDQRRRYARA